MHILSSFVSALYAAFCSGLISLGKMSVRVGKLLPTLYILTVKPSTYMRIPAFCVVIGLFAFSCEKRTGDKVYNVKSAMDDIVTRLYKEVPPDSFSTIDEQWVLKFLRPEEKSALASQYQYFNVNVPVRVSLMHEKSQKVLPFWLEESGFVKTGNVVKNEEYDYDVWQKQFPAGRVELGINGFDKHRPVYFIAVTPVHTGDNLKITEVHPGYPLDTLKEGAFTYHDWSGLVLTSVPTEMRNQTLFTTVRGRAREAHIIGAFRKTIFPSNTKPDQIMQTWSDSPKTTIDIQWRTSTNDPRGEVRYWQSGKSDTATLVATLNLLEDRMLYNDRYVHHFTAHLSQLTPGVEYFYQVGSKENNIWSDVENFKTEAEQSENFSFVWFGDTHCFPDSGKLVRLAEKSNMNASFYSIAGDIVSTGLHRDDWDQLFGYSNGAFSRKPLMPVPGNHDRQDGLGAQLYYDLFSLPQNGPPRVDKESSYAFEYGNALFLMIDATSDVAEHTEWLEQNLSSTRATWKFVMFHFPPYNFEEPYPDIQQAWVPLFDKYHVDMVMGGHIHYYMRSKPMHSGAVVPEFDNGTVYAISISIPSRHDSMTPEPYAAVQYDSGYFYQHMEIEGNTLRYKAIDSQGNLKDEFVINKKR